MGSCFTKPETCNNGGSSVVPYSLTPAKGNCNCKEYTISDYISPPSKPQTIELEADLAQYETSKPAPLILYGTELCPFTSRIRIALQYKGIPAHVYWLNATDERSRSKQLLAYMLPADGKLPILQHEDQTISGSSDEILEYIERTFPHPSLMGKSHSKGVSDWVEFIRDTLSPLIVKALYNADLLSQQDAYSKDLNSAFGKLDAAMAKYSSKGPYFYGDQFTLVDVYLIPFLLLRHPLAYFHGIEISSAYSHVSSYGKRMTSFSSYAPVRVDMDLLLASVSKVLEKNSNLPLLSITLLQHRCMLRHLQKLISTVDELIVATKQTSRIIDPVKGSFAMQVKKLSGRYVNFLELMLEHAQMEERVIFPALEKADRGITKSANQSHGRHLPVLNGIKEDIKAAVALDHGNPSRKEVLQSIAGRLKSLQAHTAEHFQEEERDLFPLLNVAGVGSRQQVLLIENCISIMESTHTKMFPFMLSGLQPHEIHQYLNLICQGQEAGKTSNSIRAMIVTLKQAAADDNEYGVGWAVVRERLPALAALVLL